jgi:hypothetical protein
MNGRAGTARQNIKKAQRAAKRKQTLKRLPKKVRVALGERTRSNRQETAATAAA